MRYLRANGLYLLSVFLLDDQGKSFLQIDPLNALMILTAAVPAITYPETERTFALGRDVRISPFLMVFVAINCAFSFTRTITCCACA